MTSRLTSIEGTLKNWTKVKLFLQNPPRANKHIKKPSLDLVLREMTTKTTMESHCMPSGRLTLRNTTDWGNCGLHVLSSAMIKTTTKTQRQERACLVTYKSQVIGHCGKPGQEKGTEGEPRWDYRETMFPALSYTPEAHKIHLLPYEVCEIVITPSIHELVILVFLLMSHPLFKGLAFTRLLKYVPSSPVTNGC